MLELPLPTVVAALLAFLTARALLSRRVGGWLSAVVALCALQSLTIALVQHHGWTALALWQPIGATLIPPLVWLAFVESTERAVRPGDAVHALGPVLAVIARAAAPPLLDVLIPVLYVGYALALLRRARRGTLPAVRLDSGELPRSVWTTLALLLALSALGDVAIALALALGRDDLRAVVAAAVSSASLLIIGVLVLIRDLDARATNRETAPAPRSGGGPDTRSPRVVRPNASGTVAGDAPGPERGGDTPSPNPDAAARADADHVAALERLDTAMRDERMFLDPDLTLERLSRRLGVPAKRLSAAINAHRGENVSRHVNRHRIAHACTLLAAGTPVTETVFESGFNTRSNFNREFSRILGCPPTRWLDTPPERRPYPV